MYSLEILLTVGVGAAAAGIITAYLLVKFWPSSNKTQRHLEEQLHAQQQKQQEYQHEVTQHFSETAQLLNQLTSSYQDVHQHLTKGAQLLAEDQDNPILISLNKTEDTEPVIAGEEIAADHDTSAVMEPSTNTEDAISETDTSEDNGAGHIAAENTESTESASESNLGNNEDSPGRTQQEDDLIDKKP